MQFRGAVVTLLGDKCAIISVKSYILTSMKETKEMQQYCSRFFPDMPIILMAQDSSGAHKYYGRDDITKFLANINVATIPWKIFTVNEN